MKYSRTETKYKKIEWLCADIWLRNFWFNTIGCTIKKTWEFLIFISEECRAQEEFVFPFFFVSYDIQKTHTLRNTHDSKEKRNIPPSTHAKMKVLEQWIDTVYSNYLTGDSCHEDERSYQGTPYLHLSSLHVTLLDERVNGSRRGNIWIFERNTFGTLIIRITVSLEVKRRRSRTRVWKR